MFVTALLCPLHRRDLPWHSQQDSWHMAIRQADTPGDRYRTRVRRLDQNKHAEASLHVTIVLEGVLARARVSVRPRLLGFARDQQDLAASPHPNSDSGGGPVWVLTQPQAVPDMPKMQGHRPSQGNDFPLRAPAVSGMWGQWAAPPSRDRLFLGRPADTGRATGRCGQWTVEQTPLAFPPR